MSKKWTSWTAGFGVEIEERKEAYLEPNATLSNDRALLRFDGVCSQRRALKSGNIDDDGKRLESLARGEWPVAKRANE
jgi:hypothetical protein